MSMKLDAIDVQSGGKDVKCKIENVKEQTWH